MIESGYQFTRTTFWEWLAELTRRRSRPILVVVGAATIGFSYFLTRIEVDTSLLGFVRPAARALVETIEDDFDEGGFLTLIFESQSSQSLLAPALLHQQLRIMQEIKNRYRVTTHSLVEGIDAGLKRVKRKSLLDYQDYSSIAEGIMGLSGGRTLRDLEKVSRHFLSHPEAIAFYAKLRIATGIAPIRPGGSQQITYRIPYVKAIKALVRLDPSYARQERKQLAASIRDLVHSRSTPELKVYAINDDLVSYDIDVRSRENTFFLALMVLIVNVLCVWTLFRDRRELLLVFSILGTASVWTFGVASLCGFRLTFVHLISLPILWGTGDDMIFVFGGRLAEERAKGKAFPEALRATFAGVGTAIFLTTCTTFLGFLISALTTGQEVVFSFYMLISISMMILFLLDVLLQGALRTELLRREAWVPGPAATGAPSFLDSGTKRLAAFSCRLMTTHPRLLLVGSGLLVVLALGAAPKLPSEMVREDVMRPSMPAYTAHTVQQKYFGHSRVGYVLFTGEVENPILLEKMRLLEQRLAAYPTIEQVLGTANVESVIGLIDKLGIAITPTTAVRTVFDRLIQSERTANYVLDMTFREAAEHVVRKQGERYDGLLMRFFVRGEAASRVLEACGAIERELQALAFARLPGIEIRIGGGDITYGLESVYYAKTMVWSFFLSLVGNWLVLLVVWRRLGPSLVALIPLLFAATLIVGLMAVCGIRLNPMNVSIGAILVGLGVDYSIHFIERFEEERQGGLGRRQAMQTVLVTMGPHILVCVLTTVVGFAAACVLALPLAMSFGLLTGGAIALAYLASILLLPVCLAGFQSAHGDGK